jgi:predicted Zn-dependent peptidase
MAQLSGDPYYLERRLRQLEAVTAEDLKKFAATYLVDANLTIGEIPASAAPKSPTSPAITEAPKAQ